MKTESEAISPAVLSGDVRSVSEIVSELRAAFRSVDFDRAEAVLAAREESLRQEIARQEQEKQSIVEVRELERVEMADLRAELERRGPAVPRAELEEARARARPAEERLEKLLEEKEREISELKQRRAEAEAQEREISELKRRRAEAEAEAERWKRSYAEIDARVAMVEADAVELLRTDHPPAARKVASERSESTGRDRSSRNAGDAKSAPPKQPIYILDSDDDCALQNNSSKKESSPKVLKRKRSSSLNLSTNKNDEDTGDHDITDTNMARAQQHSVAKPVASPADNQGLATEASPTANGAETLNATPNQPQLVLGRCSNENTSSVAEKSALADTSKSFWERFGEIKFKDSGNSSSSSSDSDSDSNS